MSEECRLAVLASGSGSNFQAILDHCSDSESVRPVLLIASRPGIGALARAAEHEVATAVVPDPTTATEEAGEAEFLLGELREHRADLVVLAGYLRLVPPTVVRTYWGRIINIHPALLPSFGGKGLYGRRVHEAVLESGVRVTGVTVHFVDERYDRGPIIAQWPVPVCEGDDPERLSARVLRVEHRVLPAVVEALATGRVRLDEDGHSIWDPDWFDGDRFRAT